MKSKLCCSLRCKTLCFHGWTFAAVFLAGSLIPTPALAGDAPAWLHAVASAPVPDHDDKADAVELYSEDVLNVASNGKIKSVRRRAFKILRPGGKGYGLVVANVDSETKVTGMRGWSIPLQGKDYEVKEKDAVESSLLGVANGELVSDLRSKILQIPASDPGNIVGYEVEQEGRPYVLQDEWVFQATIPSREARYTLQLPPDWEYKATWMNYPEAKPESLGGNTWQWTIRDLKAIKTEDEMPPWRAVAGQMVVSLLPPGGSGQQRGFENWGNMGAWYAGLLKGRDAASPELKLKVASLTAGLPVLSDKMRAIANFIQHDIRYVAIQLGIGGWQPHPAAEVFDHHYGDCKDKATLLKAMLREIGVESYLVVINTNRGAVTDAMPAHQGVFNHAILAVRLPESVKDPSLSATIDHPKLGRLLFFDPTNELTPFGQLSGYLQENYGLLIGPSAGEMIELPAMPPASTGIQRSGKLTLDAAGTLQGEIKEVRLGDQARWQREVLHGSSQKAEWVKPIESLLAHSFANFRIARATVTNLEQNDLPFGYSYELVAENYGKTTGNMMLVRPRVLGTKSSGVLDTKEPRNYPVDFEGPSTDTDSFEITLPPGFVVDDLPPAVNADYLFASYHSKTEVNGNILHYSRTMEIKQLAVPVAKMADLKRFYQIINGDERNTAVLKLGAAK